MNFSGWLAENNFQIGDKYKERLVKILTQHELRARAEMNKYLALFGELQDSLANPRDPKYRQAKQARFFLDLHSDDVKGLFILRKQIQDLQPEGNNPALFHNQANEAFKEFYRRHRLLSPDVRENITNFLAAIPGDLSAEFDKVATGNRQ